MAKKQQNKTDDEVKTDTSENTAETDRTLDETKKDVKEDAKDESVLGGEVINPIAYAVTLRAIHPQASYGRCGYRFNKESAVEIPAGDLTGEQVIALAEDPWLELVPVCDE